MKMFSSSSDLPQKSLQIKKDDKFFSWLLSKEISSMASPSFRVYYGGVSGAVPFLWESQPGTPKHPFCESTDDQTSLPPLNPPPSYYSTNTKQNTKQHSSSISKLLSTSLRRTKYLKKAHVPMSLSSSSSGSSLHSSNSAPATAANFGRRNGFSRPRSRSFDDRVDDDDDDDDEEDEVSNIRSKSTSTLCFGGSGLRGSYSIVIIKKAFLGMVRCKLN